MIHALISGTLLADPVLREAVPGTPVVTALVRTISGGQSIVISLSSFDAATIARLLALRHGDSLAATGELKQGRWTDKGGNAQQGLRVTATALLTPFEVGERRHAARFRKSKDGGGH
ncbi:MAG: hypothetical protein AB7P21_00215 [Lautropia sp.]